MDAAQRRPEGVSSRNKRERINPSPLSKPVRAAKPVLRLWLGDSLDENLSFDKFAKQTWTPHSGAPKG